MTLLAVASLEESPEMGEDQNDNWNGLLSTGEGCLGKIKKLSILMNVFDGENDIPHILDSLLRQTIQDFELVILDDGSTDRTVQVVQRYANEFKELKLIRAPHLGLRLARERGFRSVNGDVCLILDTDEILPAEDTLQRFLEPFEDPKVAGVGGIKLPSTNDAWVSQGLKVVRQAVYQGRVRPDGTAEFVVGGAMAVRVEAVNAVGGFTTNANVGEDKDISWRLREAGWKLVGRNDIVILHKDPTTVQGIYRDGYKMGRREFATHLEYPEKILFWKTWVRFYPILVIGLFLVDYRAGLVILVANYLFGLWSFRKAPGSFLSRSFAWVVWTIGNIGWNIGLFAGVLAHIRGEKIHN
jgi:glycosyltransferase involved in cell wall biosynthesis